MVRLFEYYKELKIPHHSHTVTVNAVSLNFQLRVLQVRCLAWVGLAGLVVFNYVSCPLSLPRLAGE